MAFGKQASYFLFWVGNSNINLYRELFDSYFFPFIVIALMFFFLIFLKFPLKNLMLFSLPSLFMFIIFFILSDNHDPRFLQWPVFCLFIALITAVSQKIPGSNSPARTRLFFTFGLLPIVFFVLGTSSDYGLKYALNIYPKLPKSGLVCPFSDSPKLNLSKMLLIDSLANHEKSLNERIRNIPDLAMNGFTRQEILDFSTQCDFAYYESGVKPGSMKNEFVNDLIEYFYQMKYRVTNFDEYVIFEKNSN
jgi:hypothetical protein